MQVKEHDGLTFSVSMGAYPGPAEPIAENPFIVPSLGFSVIEMNGAELLNISIWLRNTTDMEYENVEVHFILVNADRERIQDYVVMAGDVEERRRRSNIPKKSVIKARRTHHVGVTVDTEDDPRKVYQETRCIRIRFHFSKITKIRKPDKEESNVVYLVQ